jgi:hypothetical protein
MFKSLARLFAARTAQNPPAGKVVLALSALEGRECPATLAGGLAQHAPAEAHVAHVTHAAHVGAATPDAHAIYVGPALAMRARPGLNPQPLPP